MINHTKPDTVMLEFTQDEAHTIRYALHALYNGDVVPPWHALIDAAKRLWQEFHSAGIGLNR